MLNDTTGDDNFYSPVDELIDLISNQILMSKLRNGKTN